MSEFSSIPAFIGKLWEMVNDEKYDHLIQWCKDGSSFVIKDPVRFCSELLPIYYKHNNMASFIRQLNKYGFKKVVSIESASLKNDKTDLEFFHPNFLKDYPEHLNEIKRKISSNPKDVTYPNVMVQIAKEVQQLQQKQSIFESKLRAMKNENTALWREHSLLRHKHQNLQKLLNKLIQFLLTLVQQTRGLNIKRINLPLMIKDRSESLAAIKHHSLNQRTNKGTDKGNLSNMDNGEIIVADFLEDSAKALNEFSNQNHSSYCMKEEIDNCDIDTPSSVVAVPLQEVSPAIVYGKYVGVPKPKEDKTLKLNNSKNQKRILLEGRGESSQRPIKVKPSSILPCVNGTILKPGTPIIIKKNVLQPVSLHSPKSLVKKNKTANKDQSKNTTGDVLVKINSLPESHESETLVPHKENESVPTVSDISSIPIVLSPSGTQISPIITNPEKVEQNQNPAPAIDEDQSLEPLQNDIDNHIGAIQSDLDILKDLLQNEGISIDASTLLGLINEDPLSLSKLENMGLPNEPTTSGNELVSYYTPSLLDFIDGLEEKDNGEYILPGSPTLNTPKPDISFNLEGPSPSKRMKN